MLVLIRVSEQLQEMRRALDKDRFLAGRLVMAESMVNTQYMSASVYTKYLFAGKMWLFVLALVVLLLSSVASFFPGLWIGFWSGSVFGFNTAMYEGVLWMFVVTEMITYYVASAMLLKHGQIASRVLHHSLLSRLAHAIISFFDSTPVGRIMNRFSKDLDNLDTMISFQLQQYARVGIQLLILIGFIGYGSPWLLLAVGPLFVFFWLYLRYFRRTSVRLQRIEAITLSPIFQHFAETLPGLATIRAFGMTELESRRNFTYINGETLAEYGIRAVDSWVAIRLDLLCVIANLVVCFVMIGTSSNAYVAGFTINFVLVTVQLLSFFSLNMAQLETQMNAAERVLEYSDGIEQEAPFEIPATDPGPEWPSRGEIEFDNVQFAYRPGLPLVLNGVTVHIEGGHKVSGPALIPPSLRLSRSAWWGVRARASRLCLSYCCAWWS
jgi:ABC-type multidrug transport system fused ATPase/permease subunit